MWELWSKFMQNEAMDVYDRNNKLKRKKNLTCNFIKCRTL